MTTHCARVAVQTGLTLAQVCDHTLPQLHLLVEAVARDRAAQNLMTMQTNFAAIAACVSKEGSRHFQNVQASLMEQAEPAGKGDSPAARQSASPRNRRLFAAALLGKA